MDPSRPRFSPRRVLGDIGRLLATRWSGLLIVALAFGLASLFANNLTTRLETYLQATDVFIPFQGFVAFWRGLDPAITETAVLGVSRLSTAALFLSLLAAAFLALAPTAAVAERLGPGAALRRSLDLTRGRVTLLFALYVAVTWVAVSAAVAIGLVAPPELGAINQAGFLVLRLLAFVAVYLEMRRLNAPAGEASPAEPQPLSNP